MIKRLLALVLCAVMMSSCFLAGCTNEDNEPTGTTDTSDSDITTAPDTTETTPPGTEPAPEENTTPPSTDNGNNGGEDAPHDDPIVFTEYDLKRIAYQQTGLTQETDETVVAMSLTSGPSALTGAEVSVTVSPRVELPSDGKTFYAIVDWGDGTWSYYGPNLINQETLLHAYKTSGEYAIKACLVNLSGGTLLGWTAPQTVTVTGDDWDGGVMISKLSPFASSVSEGSAEDILDANVSTYVKTKKAASNDAEEYVGLYFDDVYRLDRLEIQFPTGQECFPSNVAVEYTTDGGTTWYSLPKYYYLFDYSEGRYRPLMDFPDPSGATLVLDMDGIVANGVRFTAKRFSVQGKTMAVSEMRAYGDKELLFYTNMGDTYDADLNNMWTIFGTAATEPGTEYYSVSSGSPFRTGMALILSTEWFEWNGLKFNWTDTDAQNANVSSLISARYGPDGWSDDEGYIWATSNHPEHLGGQRHYSLNPIYILAVRNCLLQGNYATVYQNGVEIPFMEAQNGHGQTIRDKIDKAMSYMLNTLDGKTGIMTIYDPENDGTQNGNASNYWDTHRAFGYKSAYENALFYGSLIAMADIEVYCGNTEQAAYYLELAEKVKEEYNKLFWDEEKGRYITSVNIRGDRLDFGMTMVNFYAAAYGLASEEQAQLIYDWLDGKRIIEGDTSRGEDIYGEFIYASRVNTLDMSSTGAPYYWWDHNGIMPCTPNTLGGYGNQMQNGGTIFYIAHYDMIGRINTLGADSANSRFSVIMEEFHKDSLRRNRYSQFGEYCEGVIGEFPESGLVPLTYLTGFMGVTPGAQGLRITPNLPSEYEIAGVREYHFNNNVYSIMIDRNATSSSIEFDGEKYVVTVSADSDYVITPDNRLVEVN